MDEQLVEVDVTTVDVELAKTGVDVARLEIRIRQVRQHPTGRPHTCMDSESTMMKFSSREDTVILVGKWGWQRAPKIQSNARHFGRFSRHIGELIDRQPAEI